jgi:membrane-associated protease RseP (regulator of RpoE activity)
MKRVLAAIVAVASLLGIYAIAVSALGGFEKLAAAIALLAASGTLLRKTLGIEGGLGVLLLRTQRGKRMIDRIARSAPQFWKSFADAGIVLGFGAAALALHRPRQREFAAAMLLLFASLYLLLPSLEISSAMLPVLAFSVLGGLVAFGVAATASHAYVILTTADALPGVYPVLPGITIPFFEGLLALIVLAAMHEIAHGVLSRVERVRLQSSGVLLLGVIPIGAFIDPDEKQVRKLAQAKQSRIFAAGSSMNFALAAVFLLLFLLFSAATTQARHESVVITAVLENSSAYGVIAPNATLERINGAAIGTVAQLRSALAGVKEGDSVALQISGSAVSLRARAGGKLGIVPVQRIEYAPAWAGGLLTFVGGFLSLSWVLNLLIGIINLFPIWGLDGYRIVELAARKRFGKASRVLTSALAAMLLLLILLNALPWFA